MVYRKTLLVCSIVVLLAASCVSTPPSYSSTAMEDRGERAILSNVELLGEISLGTQVLGVFLSEEVHAHGKENNVLFILKGGSSVFGGSGIAAYHFGNVGSITMAQANSLITALNDYLMKSPADVSSNQLYNFELITGLLDMENKENLRRIKHVTFAINYSITNKAKIFRTVFSGINGYQYFELTEKQVASLKEQLIHAISIKGATAPKADA